MCGMVRIHGMGVVESMESMESHKEIAKQDV